MNNHYNIYRRELSTGHYEYSDSNGVVFNANSKRLYTHVVWFRGRSNGHEFFQISQSEETANKATRARFDRIIVLKIIDVTTKNNEMRTPAQRDIIAASAGMTLKDLCEAEYDEQTGRSERCAPVMNVAIGRKLYSGMGWAR